jgi:hypothetical protein
MPPSGFHTGLLLRGRKNAMSQTPINNPPIRITDLLELRLKGAVIACSPLLDIIPVDFSHLSHQYQALVFVGRFSGLVDGGRYSFRKCYARGCKHDLCPRVSQAVMIANRYLQRDYNRLERGGIAIEKKLFTLEDSVVRLMAIKDDPQEALIIDDYMRMAKEGGGVSVNIALEYVPAIEHFEYHKNRQTFLMADFTVKTREKTGTCQRCLGCYPTESEREARPAQIDVANNRLSLLYKEFDLSSITYAKEFFA